MICRNCGAENTDVAKYCIECGASLAAETYNSVDGATVQQNADSTYVAVDSGVQKKKTWVIPVTIVAVVAVIAVAALLIFRVFGQSRVYKYYSLSVDAAAMGDEDDSWGYLGSELAEAIFGAMLKDCYVEIEANKDITILIPDMGYRTINASELADDMDDVDYSIEKDYIYLNSEGLTIVFQRVPKEEIGIYRKLLESATEITDESFESAFDFVE